MDDTFFPDELWLNREIQFTSPSPSTWKLTVKIIESFSLLSQKEPEDYQDTSFDIYMQIPNKGTQALLPDMRRRQASGEAPNILQEEREAYERLAKH
ncbi:hypothetical protein Asppvi_002479 [Aspergillus pseudoviridinutans]|uniref:Uncharacterized protein n=1 Tax=Aspergillus pseudoviridinutans TaxID=1517512 RepID=A0A9P3EQ97_9EURO|nr:uncharacterized protein Asppvi_002479 [Aspergillus pseudoviridinutans]GIJ83649.1 hypothetical protein Asppvi_002479 [Aspergillus pseudoviridinutans]